MYRLLALAVLLLLSGCASSSPESQTEEVTPPKVCPPPPLLVQRLKLGMRRAVVYHKLGREGILVPAYHVPGPEGIDWQEIQLPEGHVDLYFQMRIPHTHGTGVNAVTDPFRRRSCDRLIGLQYTNRVGWVMLWGYQPPFDDWTASRSYSK
jgi:hypothetical protein